MINHKITYKTISTLFLVLSLIMASLISCGGGGTAPGQVSAPPEPIQSPQPIQPNQLSLTLDSTKLPNGTINAPYEQNILMTASGGQPPYMYSCQSNAGSSMFVLMDTIDWTSGSVSCKIFGTPRKFETQTINFMVCDRVSCTDYSAKSLSFDIDPDPYIKKGFPVKTYNSNGTYHSGPDIYTLVGNIDDTPTLEIIVSGIANGPLYAWNFDGSPVTGWPISGFNAVGFPVMGRLSDAFPGNQVYCGYGYNWDHIDMAAFSGHGQMLPGWPKKSSHGTGDIPSVMADIDGDGYDEIFVTDQEGLHAYKADGSELSGWPQKNSGSPPAIADIDNDGGLEVISATVSQGATVYAYHRDGSPVKGFPAFFPNYNYSVNTFPVIGDVDGDGFPEIIVAYGYEGNYSPDKTSGVLLISPDGKLKRTMKASGKFTYSSAPVLADLDGDCIPEIILQTDNMVDIWKGDGTPFPGWPVKYVKEGNAQGNALPVVGDVDGDQIPEIIVVGGAQGNVRVYKRDGTLNTHFIRDLLIGNGAVPAIADIDLDGHNEIIITGDYWDGTVGYFDKVWVYNLGGPKHGTIEWGQFGGGPKHQGSYVCEKK